ncbi:MAG: hypothetical protein AAB426_12555, partial [Myxococcota bacterium]
MRRAATLSLCFTLTLAGTAAATPSEAPGTAAQRIDRFVLATEVRYDFVGGQASGVALNVPHGVAVTTASTELVARFGLWRSLRRPGQTLTALPVTAAWVLLPHGSWLRPVFAWEVG